MLHTDTKTDSAKVWRQVCQWSLLKLVLGLTLTIDLLTYDCSQQSPCSAYLQCTQYNTARPTEINWLIIKNNFVTFWWNKIWINYKLSAYQHLQTIAGYVQLNSTQLTFNKNASLDGQKKYKHKKAATTLILQNMTKRHKYIKILNSNIVLCVHAQRLTQSGSH